MGFWKELVADKTDPEGRPSKGGTRQMVAFAVGIVLGVIFFILMALGKFPKEHANTALVFILTLIGIQEAGSVVQKVQDTKIKSQQMMQKATTSNHSSSPKNNATSSPKKEPFKPLPTPPKRELRKGV